MGLAASLSLLAGFALHASAHTGAHGPPAGLASPDEVCPAGITTVIVRPADVVIKQVIEVDVHCPENTVLPIHDDVTITVANAPTSIVTKVTCIHTAHTTLTETVAPTKTVDPPSKKCSSSGAAPPATRSGDPPAKPTVGSTTSQHHSAETTGRPATSVDPSPSRSIAVPTTSASVASEPPTRPTPTPVPTFEPPTLEICPPIPEACAALRGLRGPQFAAAAPACYATLGDNLADLLLDNLFLDLIFPSLTPGDDAVDYLEEYFEESCLSELPESCTDLEDLEDDDLADALAMCEFQLGPWTTGDAGDCFEGATDGAVVTQCLEDAIFG
ncbi:uncharacterized protein DNG_04976 [Cephalotrichum gorgonifer]|uniref:Uncharacterized protein n=1 Tax=Cephalotrichum gorgonifer TaxID=2041049 RepID=A0AAE8MZL0_9PEZI|nr:uncharacterized protein DNG_04976 [Cephalotrichum gorgonifer]